MSSARLAHLHGGQIGKPEATSLNDLAGLNWDWSTKHRPAKGECVELAAFPARIYACREIVEESSIEHPPREGGVKCSGIDTHDQSLKSTLEHCVR